MINIGVSDVIEQKVSVVSNEPPSERKEDFGERRMDIKEVCSLQILQSTRLSELVHMKQICRNELRQTRLHSDDPICRNV